MEQAIIITAYKNFEQLRKLVRALTNDFNIYIHIDKKTKWTKEKIETLQKLASNKKCLVVSKYEINWGGYNHLNAIIDLLELAYKDGNEYFHIITGEDYPVKSSTEIAKFGEENKDKIFMSCKKVSELGKNISDRYHYFYLTDYLDYKKNAKLKKCITFLIHKLFKIKRRNIGNFTEKEIYKGLVYVSLPKDAVRYVFEYINKDRNYLNDLKTCEIAEEFFFQTILMNSRFKENIVCEHLRYINWTYKNGSNPAILDKEDYEKIKNGNYLFMRKIGKQSKELLKLLGFDY